MHNGLDRLDADGVIIYMSDNQPGLAFPSTLIHYLLDNCVVLLSHWCNSAGKSFFETK